MPLLKKMILFLISYCLVFDHPEFPIHSSIPAPVPSNIPEALQEALLAAGEIPLRQISLSSTFLHTQARLEEVDTGNKRSSQVEVSGEISPPFCHVFWGVNENGSSRHFAKATNLFLYDFLQLFYIFMFLSKSRSL